MNNVVYGKAADPIIARVFLVGNKMVVSTICDADIPSRMLCDMVEEQVRKYGCRVIKCGEIKTIPRLGSGQEIRLADYPIDFYKPNT